MTGAAAPWRPGLLGTPFAIGSVHIGVTVLLIGLLLAGYGLFGGPQLNRDGSAFTKDVLWGAVVTVVGVVILAPARFFLRRRGAVQAHDERND